MFLVSRIGCLWLTGVLMEFFKPFKVGFAIEISEHLSILRKIILLVYRCEMTQLSVQKSGFILV